MKRLVYVGMLALVAGICMIPATSAAEHGEKKFTMHGEVRVRFEYLENFTDFVDHSDTGPTAGFDDSLDFWPYRVRVGLKGQFSNNVGAYVELQNHGTFGNNLLPVGVPQQGASDPLIQDIRLNPVTNDTSLYQGYIDLNNIGDTVFSARLGRQEVMVGNELHLGDLDFYSGQSFDGARLNWDWDRWDLDVMYFNLQERNVGLLANLANIGADDDITLTGVVPSFEIGEMGQMVEPYILYYRSGSNVLPFDPWKVYTVGALWKRAVNSAADVDDLPFDWSLEAALQTGDLGPSGPSQIDAGGTIVEFWFGYNFNHGGDSRSRVHIGGLMASGDDDLTDMDQDAFIPLFPDIHANNRLGDLDLFGAPISTAGIVPGAQAIGGFPLGGISNIIDVNLGYAWYGGGDKHGFRASLHRLSLTEDTYFVGHGPVVCPGVSTLMGQNCVLPDDDIGLELDLRYAYQYSDHVTIEAGLANLFAGDLQDKVLTAIGGADDARRFWGQARLRF